jgi:hypothetical protein
MYIGNKQDPLRMMLSIDYREILTWHEMKIPGKKINECLTLYKRRRDVSYGNSDSS